MHIVPGGLVIVECGALVKSWIRSPSPYGTWATRVVLVELVGHESLGWESPEVEYHLTLKVTEKSVFTFTHRKLLRNTLEMRTLLFFSGFSVMLSAICSSAMTRPFEVNPSFSILIFLWRSSAMRNRRYSRNWLSAISQDSSIYLGPSWLSWWVKWISNCLGALAQPQDSSGLWCLSSERVGQEMSLGRGAGLTPELHTQHSTLWSHC